LKTTTFASARHLETTLQRYLHLYNQHIPKKNLGHVTPIAKLQEYYRIKPKTLSKKPINHPGPDTLVLNDGIDGTSCCLNECVVKKILHRFVN